MTCPTAPKDTFLWGSLGSCVHASASGASVWHQPITAWAAPQLCTCTSKGRTSPPNPGKMMVKTLTVHHREQLPIAHAKVCVTAEGARNLSKISFRLCRSQAQQNSDLQKGHPTDSTTTSAGSNSWQRSHCQKQHSGARLHAAESSPPAQGHAAKGSAALPGRSLQKRPWWLQYLQ